MPSYSDVFGKLGRWAIGQRAVHDLIIHPLMALTGYADWTVRLHDYHAFVSLKEEPGRLGITGPKEEVEAAIAALGIPDERVLHFHSDGALCFGIVDTNPPEVRRRSNCKRCNGTRRIPKWERGDDRHYRQTWVRCPDCS